MSLYQLQELASRQQKQIESTHMLIMNKEQRLNYLSSVQGSQQGPILDYDKNLNLFKEKLALQEANLRKLRLLKGQIQKQRNANSNICKCTLCSESDWQPSIACRQAGVNFTDSAKRANLDEMRHSSETAALALASAVGTQLIE